MLPPELIQLILQLIDAPYAPYPSLDPPLVEDEPSHTVYSRLGLISQDWFDAVRPFIWRNVNVGRPASYEHLLWLLGSEDDGIEVPCATPNELASPTESRDASPEARGRRSSFAKTSDNNRSSSLSRLLRAHAARSRSPGPSLPLIDLPSLPWDPSNPGLLVQQLSFARFRTHGLRRTLRESSQQRFVTSARLLKLLHGTRAPGSFDPDNQDTLDDDVQGVRGRLVALGLTEYMDSALGAEVLEEILLRGGIDVTSYEEGALVTSRKGSPAALAACPIIALDLCGCVSGRFIQGLKDIVHKYSLSSSLQSPNDTESSRSTFPHLRRLGLSQTLIAPDLFTTFVTSFPNLTHLDLTNTRASPTLLDSLTASSPHMRLRCLSLARCRGLDRESVIRFLLSDTCDDLTGLSLAGDKTASFPIFAEDLIHILNNAKFFKSGQLQTLDLATLPLTDEIINSSHNMSKMPHLVDLGLAHCPRLSYEGIATFLTTVAPHVQVLDLVGTGTATFRNQPTRNIVMGLHSRLLSTLHTLHQPNETHQRSCDLRVLELEESLLDAIQGGVNNWKVIWGRGRRGWYIDVNVASKPLDFSSPLSTTINTCSQSTETSEISNNLVSLDSTDPRHLTLLKMVKANGNGISTSVGWHAKKMDVLQGMGMLGREEGIYGFHAYA